MPTISAMLDWLRLMRASGLATIVSNFVAAIAAVEARRISASPEVLGALLLDHRWQVASALGCGMMLYACGMIWNDLADADRDRALRPKRPLPAGRIGYTSAFMVGVGLAVGALMVSLVLGWRGFFAAGLTLALAMTYNLGAKQVPYLGSLVMAATRTAHAFLAMLALGSDLFDQTVQAFAALVGLAEPVQGPVAWYPLLIGLYVLGLTLVSELESRSARRIELLAGAGLMLAAVALAWVHAIGAPWMQHLLSNDMALFAVAVLVATLWAAWLLWRVGRPWWRATSEGKRELVGPVIGASLGGIIMVDGLWAAAHHPLLGLGVLVLLLPFTLVSRQIRMD